MNYIAFIILTERYFCTCHYSKHQKKPEKVEIETDKTKSNLKSTNQNRSRQISKNDKDSIQAAQIQFFVEHGIPAETANSESLRNQIDCLHQISLNSLEITPGNLLLHKTALSDAFESQRLKFKNQLKKMFQGNFNNIQFNKNSTRIF